MEPVNSAQDIPMHDDKWFLDRRKEIVVLMMRFLCDHGYSKTYESLCQESHLNLGQMATADNIDLLTIVQEYIHNFRGKFGKVPILIRQLHPMLPEVRHDMQSMPVRQEMPPRSSLRDLHPQGAPPPMGPGPSLMAAQPPRIPVADRRMLLNPKQPQHCPPPHDQGSRMVLPAPDTRKHELLPSSPMQGAGGDGSTPATFVLGSVQPCTQEQLMAHINEARPADLGTIFAFYRPKRHTPSKRSSAHLELSDFQEDLLYAIVGCDATGWSIRNVNNQTRVWLQANHNIDKELLQLFYKNRAPKRRRELDQYASPVS